RKKVLSAQFLLVVLTAALALLLLPNEVFAQSKAPILSINTASEPGVETNEVFGALKISMLVSSLVLLPAVLMTVTCFPRIAIVLALTRQALGTAQTPPNQVIIGLSLFLTFAIMGDTFQKIYTDAVIPYSEDQIGHGE